MKIAPFQRWLLAVVLFLAMQSGAWAHAFLYYSVPKVGGAVTNSPPEIIICFTEQLEIHGNTIQVRNDKNQEVDNKDSHRDSKDPSLLKVSLPKLPPGTYKVSWQAFSEDGHRTKGDFQFSIK